MKSRLRGLGFNYNKWEIGGSHPFDMVLYHVKSRKIAICDVKTKPRYNNWPVTGVDERLFREYIKYSEQMKCKFLLFFVDYKLKKIYYGSIHKLVQPWDSRKIDHSLWGPGRKVGDFPWFYDTKSGVQVLWHLAQLKVLCNLDVKECAQLKALDTGTHGRRSI